MANCLIALGSNLGERAEMLRQAVGALSRIARSQLLARSRWLETTPVGGPSGQGPFLNGAVLLATELAPAELHRELAALETRLGRQRRERWAARAIDLDLLLVDGVELNTPELTIPHPRMAFRRFVLEPAAEVAPWMRHPETGWTIGGLLDHLNRDDDRVVIADADVPRATRRAAQLAARLAAALPIDVYQGKPAPPRRPKLLLAAAGDPGVPLRQWRKMLALPASGPIAWIGAATDAAWLDEAAAAVQSVWPESNCPN
jgi:2-amino-4-hydroxy-6-hydroxymethyldihydropteridine diphosphokinase